MASLSSDSDDDSFFSKHPSSRTSKRSAAAAASKQTRHVNLLDQYARDSSELHAKRQRCQKFCALLSAQEDETALRERIQAAQQSNFAAAQKEIMEERTGLYTDGAMNNADLKARIAAIRDAKNLVYGTRRVVQYNSNVVKPDNNSTLLLLFAEWDQAVEELEKVLCVMELDEHAVDFVLQMRTVVSFDRFEAFAVSYCKAAEKRCDDWDAIRAHSDFAIWLCRLAVSSIDSYSNAATAMLVEMFKDEMFQTNCFSIQMFLEFLSCWIRLQDNATDGKAEAKLSSYQSDCGLGNLLTIMSAWANSNQTLQISSTNEAAKSIALLTRLALEPTLASSSEATGLEKKRKRSIVALLTKMTDLSDDYMKSISQMTLDGLEVFQCIDDEIEDEDLDESEMKDESIDELPSLSIAMCVREFPRQPVRLRGVLLYEALERLTGVLDWKAYLMDTLTHNETLKEQLFDDSFASTVWGSLLLSCVVAFEHLKRLSKESLSSKGSLCLAVIDCVTVAFDIAMSQLPREGRHEYGPKQQAKCVLNAYEVLRASSQVLHLKFAKLSSDAYLRMADLVLHTAFGSYLMLYGEAAASQAGEKKPSILQKNIDSFYRPLSSLSP
jgi:hypothetical protein